MGTKSRVVMSNKELLGGVAIALTLIGFIPYLVAALRQQIRPHVFSWIIWGSVTFIVFLAQARAGGGAGSWTIGVSGLLSLSVAVLAYVNSRQYKLVITRTDWLFFAAGMSALPFWYFTADPLWAVVILTTVDILGFGPTIRKAYLRPDEEGLFFFVAFTARNGISILALEHYSLTTVLFPAATGIACAALVVIISWRRRVLPSPLEH